MAQKDNPTEGVDYKLVEDDFNQVNIPLNENAIIAMSEEQYKFYIKKHIRIAAFNYLKKNTGTTHKSELNTIYKF